MRKFIILNQPDIIRPLDLSKAYVLEKEIFSNEMDAPVYCLKVDGQRLYFYPNEVKEVTNE